MGVEQILLHEQTLHIYGIIVGNDMNDFLDRVANILETPGVTPEMEFRSARGWGSMMGFALFVMLEDEYGANLTPEQFRELKTVGELMKVAGVEA